MKNFISENYRLPHFLDDGGNYFVSSPDLISDFDIAVCKSIDDPWSADEINGVKSLSVSLPPLEGGYRGSDYLVDVINNATNLVALSLPADLLPQLKCGVLEGVRYLSLTKPSRIDVYANILERKRYYLSDQNFEDVVFFDFYLPIKYIKNFDRQLMRKICWAGMEMGDMDKSGASLKMFDEFSDFSGFELRSIKNAELLQRVRKDVSALYLWSILPKNFNFTTLLEFEALKYIWLNGFKGDFDFLSLRAMTDLEQIVITSFSGFKNLEVIQSFDKLTLVKLSRIDPLDKAWLQEYCASRGIRLDVS